MLSDTEQVDNIDLINKYSELGLVWIPEFRPLGCKYENTSDYWTDGRMRVWQQARNVQENGHAKSMSGVPVSDSTGGHGFGRNREVWVSVTKTLKLNECPLT